MTEHPKQYLKGILPVEAQQHVCMQAFDHFWQLSQPLHFAARSTPPPSTLALNSGNKFGSSCRKLNWRWERLCTCVHMDVQTKCACVCGGAQTADLHSLKILHPEMFYLYCFRQSWACIFYVMFDYCFLLLLFSLCSSPRFCLLHFPSFLSWDFAFVFSPSPQNCVTCRS